MGVRKSYKKGDVLNKHNVKYIRDAEDRGDRKRRVVVECPNCHEEFVSSLGDIRSDRVSRCKECNRKGIGERSVKHGLRNSKVYTIWTNMKRRCYDPKNNRYNEYGKKGITVCDEWRFDITKLNDWIKSQGITEDMLGRGKLSIDRKDVNKGYSPDNCRFVNDTIQARNKQVKTKVNISGYRGVGLESYSEKYKVAISLVDKIKNIGRTSIKRDAMLMYDKYIDDNKLEHTKNNLDKGVMVSVESTDYLRKIRYGFGKDYYYSGALTKLLTKDDAGYEFVAKKSLAELDRSKLQEAADKIVKHIKNLRMEYDVIVVEKALGSNIVVTLHKKIKS